MCCQLLQIKLPQSALVRTSEEMQKRQLSHRPQGWGNQYYTISSDKKKADCAFARLEGTQE
jgi:hypothetical protein